MIKTQILVHYLPLKWRYNWERSEWNKKPLPRRSYCKYCYGTRSVYYLHDDFVSVKAEFRIMMVCTRCTYNLASITLSLTKREMALLDNTPMKRHLHSTTITDGIHHDLVGEMPVMPYGFKKGKPQYPSTAVLDKGKASILKEFK